jgi:hypothetical protein
MRHPGGVRIDSIGAIPWGVILVAVEAPLDASVAHIEIS